MTRTCYIFTKCFFFATLYTSLVITVCIFLTYLCKLARFCIAYCQVARLLTVTITYKNAL